MGSAFFRLVGLLFGASAAAVRSKPFQIGGAAVAIADVVNFDFLNQQALKIAGNSDPAALRAAVEATARLLGLDGSQILWPTSRFTGQLIVPKYLHINLQNGQVWITDRYYSRKSAMRGRFGRFGGARRYGSWRRGGFGAPAAMVVKQ